MFDPALFLAGLVLGCYLGAIFMRAIGRRYWTNARRMRGFARSVLTDARATYAAAQQIAPPRGVAAPPEPEDPDAVLMAALLDRAAPSGETWDCDELGHVQEWGKRRCVICHLDPDPDAP